MANSFFKFKHFTIQQDKCAMKVTTDACLFGALVGCQPALLQAKSILDIGAGTGLLSLMLAQKNLHAGIDAVEIDLNAFTQAHSNFNQSPWSNRLKIYHENIINFKTDFKYDVIISNPPFFENSLLSKSDQRNAALHNRTFSLSFFPNIINQLLDENGIFYVLLPFQHCQSFLQMMQSFGYVLALKVELMQTHKHKAFRAVLGFQQRPVASILQHNVTIKIDDAYTAEFIDLLKGYYLYL